MTIQQLAGSSNGKGSSGIAALLGADDGSTGQPQNAGFSAALRNSMAEADGSDQATGAGHRATAEEAPTDAAMEAETQQESAADSAEDQLNASTASHEPQPLPMMPEPNLAAAPAPTGAALTPGSNDGTEVAADPRHATALPGTGRSPQGMPQLPADAGRLARPPGAHEQIPGLRMSADNLFTALSGVAAEGTAIELASTKSGPDIATASTPQTPNLTALLGTPGIARDARPLAGEPASGATPQFHSTHTPGSAAWVQDIGARIEWLQGMKLSKAELYLHPEELGALEISIVSDNDTTSVAFITQTAAAREIIESTLPRLKELLASQGLQLDQSHVSQQSAEGHKRGTAHGEARNRAADAAEPLAESGTVRRGSGVLPSGQIDQYV